MFYYIRCFFVLFGVYLKGVAVNLAANRQLLLSKKEEISLSLLIIVLKLKGALAL